MRTSFGIEIHAGLRRIAESIEGLRDSGVNSPGANLRTLVHTYAARVRGRDDNERREIAIKEAQLTDEQYRRLPVLQRITERDLPDVVSTAPIVAKAVQEIEDVLREESPSTSLTIRHDEQATNSFTLVLTDSGPDWKVPQEERVAEPTLSAALVSLSLKLGGRV